MDDTTASGSPHDLLLRLAGRVDDDLLADARELVAVGEDGHALELVTAALAADGAVLPPAVRAELVTAAVAARIDLDAESALAPGAPDTTAHRFTAAAGADVPVIAGAEFPLLNSKEETERWESTYGKFEYKGAWTDKFKANRSIVFEMPYHEPGVVPPMPEGEPHIEAAEGTAAEFIIKMVHKYPGEVVLWAGGPLTNYALALKLDPSVATLAKEFVMMGGGLYADKGAIDPGAIDARREFNWWFDPEAARIVLRAPWRKITITPIDISVKTRFTNEMKATISKANTPVTQYLDKYSLPGYMWDEIAGAALIDPSIITGTKQLYMDIDVDHGASYGKTIFWDAKAQVPPYLRIANVQFDIDAEKFYKLYIDLMTRPIGTH